LVRRKAAKTARPIAGRQVPDPERGDLLPAEGRNVEPTQFWQRRLADGDVVEVAPETAAASAAKAKE
jgi:hypothetical protein